MMPSGAVPPPARCLSVVMPVYNERETVTQIIDRVLESPWVRQLVVVDDGSRDGTRELLKELAASRQFDLLLQPRNMGKGAAVRTGLDAARAPYVLIQDADLEYNPDQYPALLLPLLQDYADVVYGSRFAGWKYERGRLYHMLGNRLLTLLSNLATGLSLTDMETCYKAFRTELAPRLGLRENRFGLEPEITARFAQLGARIYEIPIAYESRTYAAGKKIGWRDALSAIRCIVKYGIAGRRDGK